MPNVRSPAADVREIFALVMAAGADAAARHADAAFRGVEIRRGFLAGLALAQRQMHPLRRDFLFLGQCEQLLQHVLGAAGVGAEHPEVVATPPDLHVEARLEQSQVLIERATEVGESRIVRRLEIELAQRLGGRYCHRRPRRLCGNASVTTVRANWPMIPAGRQS